MAILPRDRCGQIRSISSWSSTRFTALVACPRIQRDACQDRGRRTAWVCVVFGLAPRVRRRRPYGGPGSVRRAFADRGAVDNGRGRVRRTCRTDVTSRCARGRRPARCPAGATADTGATVGRRIPATGGSSRRTDRRSPTTNSCASGLPGTRPRVGRPAVDRCGQLPPVELRCRRRFVPEERPRRRARRGRRSGRGSSAR